MTTVRMDAAGDTGFTSSTDADPGKACSTGGIKLVVLGEDGDALVVAATIGRSDDRVAIGRIAERAPRQTGIGRWKAGAAGRCMRCF
jgi:hypothetical protein